MLDEIHYTIVAYRRQKHLPDLLVVRDILTTRHRKKARTLAYGRWTAMACSPPLVFRHLQSETPNPFEPDHLRTSGR